MWRHVAPMAASERRSSRDSTLRVTLSSSCKHTRESRVSLLSFHKDQETSGGGPPRQAAGRGSCRKSGPAALSQGT